MASAGPGVSAPETLFEGNSKFSRAAEVLQDECNRGSFPGYSALIGHKGEIVARMCGGVLSPARPTPVTYDTIYDMASVTKPMTAALAALLMVEAGDISLLQDASEFFPGRNLPHLSGVKLHHLLTHTSGLPAWTDLYTSTSDSRQALEALLSQPLKSKPGERYEYSCIGYILLGIILQSVAGEDLNSYLRKRVWQPLGMQSTGYLPDASLHASVASTRDCPARQGEEIVGSVHDGNAWRMDGISGNAGLFSCTGDVFRFCSSLLGWGELTVLSRLALQKYTTSRIEPAVGSQSYGWFCYGNDMLPSGDLLPDDTFGHTGFTGTSVVISPSEQLLIILLTNRVYTDPDAVGIRRTRRRFHNTVAAALHGSCP